MTSADGEPGGLGVTRDTFRRWEARGLIGSAAAPWRTGRGRQIGGFPPVVEVWLRTINVEPVDRSSAR